jgi:flagellar biosynthesis/type III secretory pathway M-ring protein FliF/YscJ
MDFLRRTIRQIKAQLHGLTISQRFVIGLLLVIMAGCIYWATQFASQREMMPLLNQDFTEEVLSKIVQKLDSWDESYKITGSRVLVPRSQQKRLLAKLAYEEALPADTSAGLDDLLDGTNVWTPQFLHEDRKIIKTQQKLAKIISEFPGVDSAQVIINQGEKRRLNNILPIASASVSIKTSGSVSSAKKLASSIAALVSSANNRMKREDVSVIIDGSLVPVVPAGEEYASDYIELLVKWEKLYRNKILDALNISDALVQVDLKLQNTKVNTETKTFSDDESLIATIEKTGRETESSDKESSSEPGVMANSAGPSGGESGNSRRETTEDTTSKNVVHPAYKIVQEQTPQGGISKEDRTASVSIPWSYFINIAKREAGNNDEPDIETVTNIRDRELPGLKQRVMAAFGLAGSKEYEDRVVVAAYWAEGTVSGQAGGSGGVDGAGGGQVTANLTVAGVLGDYGKHIAVSLLAMISLFMVLKMVRKASGPVDLSEEEAAAVMIGHKPMDALGVENSNIIDDEGATGLLSGLELGEEAVRSQQVLEQIQHMVRESPSVAASLVGKWVSQND